MKCAYRSPKDSARQSQRAKDFYSQLAPQYPNNFNGRLHAMFKASMKAMEVTSGKIAGIFL